MAKPKSASKAAAPAEPAEPAEQQTDAASQPVTHLLFCGSCKWDLIGRKSIPRAVENRGGGPDGHEYLAPTRFVFPSLPDLSVSAVFSGPVAAHLLLLDAQQQPYALGRNDNAQLALSDLRSRHVPVHVPLPDDQPVSLVACGRGHTVVATPSGVSYSVGLNSFGQLGNNSLPSDPKNPNLSSWQQVALPADERVVSVSAGADFSVWACASGHVFAAGHAQYGQLGNGRTGEHIESRNRTVFDTIAKPVQVVFPSKPSAPDAPVKIVQVAAGASHALALDADGKVWSWGFGGYGQLGHKSPQNELRPRRIETFDSTHYKLDYVVCGSTCSFAVQRSRKSTYFWGITKKTGESFMYPKTLFDLQGHEMEMLSCGITSTVGVTGRKVVSWGSSPTFGELGYGKGKAKSNTKPQIVEPIEGLHCTKIAEGMAFTALVVQVESDNDRSIVEQLDVNECADPDTGTKRKDTGGGGGAKEAKGKKSKKRRKGR